MIHVLLIMAATCGVMVNGLIICFGVDQFLKNAQHVRHSLDARWTMLWDACIILAVVALLIVSIAGFYFNAACIGG